MRVKIDFWEHQEINYPILEKCKYFLTIQFGNFNLDPFA